MSWKILINDKKNEIWDHEVELIVKDLPEKFRKFIPAGETMKQSYGYPAYLTIGIPDKHGVTLSGSYVTNTAEDSKKFVEYFIDKLKENGHYTLDIRLAKDSSGDMFGIMDFLANKAFKDLFSDPEEKTDDDVSEGTVPSDEDLKPIESITLTIGDDETTVSRF